MSRPRCFAAEKLPPESRGEYGITPTEREGVSSKARCRQGRLKMGCLMGRPSLGNQQVTMTYKRG
eukprot:12593728-Prorocentrum_lima.AAC.1